LFEQWRTILFYQKADEPSRITTPQMQTTNPILMAKSKCFSNNSNNSKIRLEEPCGELVPASHASMVFLDTPMDSANTLWDMPDQWTQR